MRRTEVWGDDPSEQDADATLASLSAEEIARERRWHDSKVVFPFKVVVTFLARNGKRIGVAIAGGLLIIVGIALLVLPGPGWLFIFLGLGVLATEFVWAERMLNKAKAKAQEAKDKVNNRRLARSRRRVERRSAGRIPSTGIGADSSVRETPTTDRSPETEVEAPGSEAETG